MMYPVPKIPGRRFVLLILRIDIQDLKVSICNIRRAYPNTYLLASENF
jgi:hypothetical protein